MISVAEKYSAARGVNRREKGEFRKGLSRGVDSVQQMGAGLGALVGRATGIEALEESSMRAYENQADQMAAEPAKIATADEIKSTGDAVDFAVAKIAEMLPQVATMMGTGGVVGAAAKAAAKRAITKDVAAGMTKKAAAEKFALSATSKGAIATNVGLMTGSAAGRMSDETGDIHTGKAVAAGAIGGVIDTLPVLSQLNMFKTGLGDAIQSKLKKSLLKVSGSSVFEGGTEILQSAVENAAIEMVKSDIDNWSNDDIDQMQNIIGDWKTAGLAGMFGGAALSGTAETVSSLSRSGLPNTETDLPNTETTPDKETATDQSDNVADNDADNDAEPVELGERMDREGVDTVRRDLDKQRRELAKAATDLDTQTPDGGVEGSIATAQKKQIEIQRTQLDDAEMAIKERETEYADQRKWLDEFNAIQSTAQAAVQPKKSTEGTAIPPTLAPLRQQDVVQEDSALEAPLQRRVAAAYRKLQTAKVPPQVWKQITKGLPDNVHPATWVEALEYRVRAQTGESNESPVKSTRPELTRRASQIKSELPIEVVDTHEALPYKTDKRAKAGLHKGKIFVNAEAIKSVSDFNTAVMHELVGHHGIEKVLGGEFKQIESAVDSLKGTEIEDIKKAVRNTYPREQFYKEVLARLAEKRASDTGAKQVFRKLRQVLATALRGAGLKGRIPIADIDALIDDAIKVSKAPTKTLQVTKAPSEPLDPEVLQQLNIDARTVRNKSAWFRDKWINTKNTSRPALLAFLGRHQLVKSFKHILPRAMDYEKSVRLMAAVRNEWQHRAGVITSEASEWTRKNNEKALALYDVMHDSRIYGVDPTNHVEMDQEKLDKYHAAVGKLKAREQTKKVKRSTAALERIVSREAQAADIIERFDALPSIAKKFYMQIRDYNSEMFDAQTEAMLQQIEQSNTTATAKATQASEVRRTRKAIKLAGPYFALSRFGEYAASVRDRNGEYIYRHFETETEAKRWTAIQVAEGAEDVKSKKLASADGETEIVPGQFVDAVSKQVDELVEDNPELEGLKDTVHQLYLKSLPALSDRKHSIHAKNVKGYDEDALRSFSQMSFHASANLGRIAYGTEMRRHVDGLELDYDISTDKDLRRKYESATDQLERIVSDPELDKAYVIEHFRGLVKDADDSAEVSAYNMTLRYLQGDMDLNKVLAKHRQHLANAEKITDENKSAARDGIESIKSSLNHAINPQMSSLANGVNAFGFVWMLGATPAAAAINTTQTYFVSLPAIASKYGFAKTASVMAKANKDFFKGGLTSYTKEGFSGGPNLRNNLKGEELDMLNELEIRRGNINRTQTHDLLGLSDEGTLVGGNKAKVYNAVGYMFHRAEIYNRQITALTAYRLARAKGTSHEQAINEAQEYNDDTHFVYENEARAQAMRGPAARIFLQFKQYSIGLTYLYARTAKEALGAYDLTPAERAQAKRQFGMMFFAQFMAAGALGLPGARVIASITDAFFDAIGVDEEGDDDYEPWLRQWLADSFSTVLPGEHGKTAGLLVSKGVIDAFTPLSVSDRLSASTLFFREPDPAAEGDEVFLNLAENILGPTGGILKNAVMGYQDLTQGFQLRAAEKLTPKFMKDVIRTARYGLDDGVVNKKGDLTYDLEWYEYAVNALGFTPSGLTERYAQNSAIYSKDKILRNYRSRLLRELNLARTDSNGKRAGEIRRVIKEFNSKNPDVAIKRSNINKSWKMFNRQRREAVNGVSMTTKTRRKAAEEYTF